MRITIKEGEPLYMSTAELTDWYKGDTDEIYAFKVVRAARYDALAALVAAAVCPNARNSGHEHAWQCQWCDERNRLTKADETDMS
jgi:hypothetical protein